MEMRLECVDIIKNLWVEQEVRLTDKSVKLKLMNY